MSLIGLIIFVAIVGLALWLFETQIPVPSYVKVVIRVLVVIVIICWLLKLAGFAGPSFRFY